MWLGNELNDILMHMIARKINFFLISSLAVVWLASLSNPASAAQAQINSATVKSSLPSDWFLFWRGVGEQVKLAVTFDPLEHSKKRLEYAQYYLTQGEAMIAAGKDDLNIQARGISLVARSNGLLSIIVSTSESWQKKDAVKVGEFITALDTFIVEKMPRVNDALASVSDIHKPNASLAQENFIRTAQSLTDVIIRVRNQSSVGGAVIRILSPEVITRLQNDFDRDGITNDEEKKIGTNPRDFDTDGDGLSDKKELDVYKSDPKNPDTDGDGFWDGQEMIKGFSPLGAGKFVPQVLIDSKDIILNPTISN